MSVEDKLSVFDQLVEFGFDYVEGGWPGSNPKDKDFFARCASMEDTHRDKLVAFGSTRRKFTKVEDDKQVEALITSGARSVCLVGKASLSQVENILGATAEEGLLMISDTVSYLVSKNIKVFVDLEHYFDGYLESPDYASRLVEACCSSGASAIVLCDTNGGTLPWELETFTKTAVSHPSVVENKVTVGVHCHNDIGMAVANSLAAVKGGAGLVQGCVNGVGERTGNADIVSIIGTLALKMGTQLSEGVETENLTSLSRFVDEVLNRAPDQAQPYVGSAAFAHKGGLHVSAMEKDPTSYQHIDPALVGNVRRTVVSELSGRMNIVKRLQEIGVDGNEDEPDNKDWLNERATAILTRVKKLESIGYTFEGADASVKLMMLHATKRYCPPFRVLDYSATVWDQFIDSASRVLYKKKKTGGGTPGKWGVNAASDSLDEGERATARATVKVQSLYEKDWIADDPEHDGSVEKIERLEVADGNGPVDALALALKRALVPSYPFLSKVQLTDYKVRILDNEAATEAATRVLIEFTETETNRKWNTVSVDRNVISASLNALVDGYEYALLEHETFCMLCPADYDEIDIGGWE